ncbi:MAG: type IV secretion system protein [Actinomycetota bacterium]
MTYLRDQGAWTSTPLPAQPVAEGADCAWWNLVCHGGQQVADSSLSALTQSMVNGLASLFGQITKIVDESTRVPIADETYRDTYYGFVGLAVPVIVLVYFLALISAGLRRDPRALTRATVGVAVAAIGGVVYVVFAQVLIALDDWLAHAVVAVTGADFQAQMTDMALKFEAMGGGAGGLAADFLMLILMLFALIAGVILWVVLLLRKMAILVVVALAPLLIAGWLWTPTRSWSRKATEVLIALVFCKSVIYVIFGIGMSLLLRDNQSLSDFVGVVVLLAGACFAPLVTLRLVHFAADSQLAGEMVGTLRAGAQPTLDKVRQVHAPGASRGHMAKEYAAGQKASSARGAEAVSSPKAVGPQAGGGSAVAGSGAGAAGGAGAGGAGAGAAAGGTTTAAAAGPVGVALAAGATAATAAARAGKQAGQRAGHSMAGVAESRGEPSRPPTSPGPTADDQR